MFQQWNLWTPATTAEVEVYSTVTGLAILFRCGELEDPIPANLTEINVMSQGSQLHSKIQVPESAKTFAAIKIAQARYMKKGASKRLF